MATSIKLEIDDTVPLQCVIQATETEDDHVVYLIKIQRGFDNKFMWQIKKRYSDFDDLYTELKVSNYELPLPPKKAFGNMKREFLSTRQLALQVICT
jgi:PX domain-containing protein kinase-like protein